MSMTHVRDTSYYPKAGMFREGRRMYSVRPLKLSDSVWCGYVERGAKIIITHTREFLFESIVITSDVFDGQSLLRFVNPTLQGVYLAIHVWRIQRATRRFLSARRALAMAMGLHARLGQQCAFACLPADLLGLLASTRVIVTPVILSA